MFEEKAKEIAEKVEDYLNTFNSEKRIKKLVKELRKIHPTLQQYFTRLCVYWFLDLAVEDTWDDRIKASVKLAKKLEPELKKAYLPVI